MRKKITLLIALLALTVSSWAQSNGVQIGDFWYQLETQGSLKLAYVMKLPETGTFESYGSSVSGNVVIPSTVVYDDVVYEVLGLLDYAFVGCSNITSVTIEEGVLSVDHHAFWECSSLTTVTLPSTIMDLGNQAFGFSGLTTITIKATTPPSYGSSLFSDSEGLAHIYVPAASVTAYKEAEGWSDHAGIIAAIPAAPASDGTITWEARQVSHVRFDGYSEDDLRSSGVIKNIIASHERTDAGNCSFQNGQIWMENNGYVKFKSIAGNFTGIVIRCSDLGSPSNLSDGWSSQAVAKTLTWTGDAEEVTLSGNIGCTISSIEFTYTPAAAPHVGEKFEQAYQLYEITGAHTAKVPAQSFGGTFAIPEYVDYDEVRYYITEIDDYAFYNEDDLFDITGGENIARIGAHAFEGCTHMRSFSLDGGVLDEIGVDAFKNCKLLAYYASNTTTPPVLESDIFAGDELLNHILIDYFGVAAYKEADGWSAYESIIDYRGTDASVGEKFFDLVQMYTGLYEVTTPATYPTPGEAKVIPYTSYINNIYPITRTGTLVIPEDANYMGREYAITGIGENAYKDSTRFNAVMIPQ